MTLESNPALKDFLSENIIEKWGGARKLMAAREMQTASADPTFERAFLQLGEICIRADGTEQLLAIALAVRISELVKGEYRSVAASYLKKALVRKPASLRLIGDPKELPEEAKASEIRENVALALRYADGDWVFRYLIEAIGWEDRSARCRLELFRQLIAREPKISTWLESLSALPWPEMWTAETPDRAGRLRDLALSMAEVIRSHRNAADIDENTGPALASLMQKLVILSPRAPRPQKLPATAEAVIDLLDEILATEFTLIPDPEAYAPLAIIARWWQSNSYPPPVFSSLIKITRRIRSAVRLRARMGQRSEMLIARLRQGLGSEADASRVLLEIAESEKGLSPDIDDWLRGNIRENSPTAMAIGVALTGTNEFEISKSIALLMLDCMSARQLLAKNSSAPLAAEVRNICNRVDAIALQLRLTAAGEIGDIVEFNPAAHRTLRHNR